MKNKKPPCKLLVRGVQVTLKTILAIVVLGCLSEVEGKFLLLKTMQTQDTEPRGLKLDPI